MANEGLISVLSDEARLMKTSIDGDIRVQNMNRTVIRNLARPVKAFGKNKGSTVEIEKYRKLARATSELSELRSVPTKRPDINFTTVTVKEYGNAVAETRRAKTLAEYSVDETLKAILSINMTESMDFHAGQELKNSDVFYTPTSASAGTFDRDGTVSTAAAASLTSAHVRDIVSNMKTDNVPRWDGQNYLAILHVFTMQRIFEDQASGGVVDLHKYEMPQAIINGEVGIYYGTRFVEENNVFDGTIGGSAFLGDGVFLGYDALAEALAEPEYTSYEMTDHQRFCSWAWIALTAFKKVWTFNTDGQYSIVYLHSNN